MTDEGWDEQTRDEDVVDPLIGRVLGSRYRIEALLGKGAMGAVYRARHVKVGRAFAVKVLHERLLVDPKLRKRFEREAELAGKLHHINVIGVVDVGETEDGIHFMVMEFAEGQTLGSLVDGPMDPKRAINIAQQLCDGLQHAHEHGLIHRDFKPENVIVEKDRFGHERPRIVDFGIAILRDDADDPEKKDRLTTAGLVLGTPHYMAPEHAMGAGIDHRIDLFALGVIMYELLTGSLPFDGDGVDVARANLIAPTPAMGVRVPGVIVDPLLEAFTRLLMQKKPADRPESAKAARHLLDLIERDRPMAARILGVVLAEPTAPAAAPPAAKPDERAMPPVDPDAPPPIRATIASTPSTRAETVPERNPAHRAPSSLSMGAVPSQSMEPLAARSRWPLIAAIGSALAIAAVIVVVATRSSGTTAPSASASSPPADAVTANVLDAAAVADLVAIDATLAPEGSATAVIDPPPAGSSQPPAGTPSAPTGTKPTGTKPTGPTGTTGTKPTGTTGTKPTGTKPTGTKPTGGTTAPPPDTSSAAVANLYGTVGRELKALDLKRGADIAQPMWQRFRQLRINDALVTPEKRAAAERMLSQLRREIAAAM
ncbi:MAG: serine/threonine-protein kinase [Kofleriaceae bacterium]